MLTAELTTIVPQQPKERASWLAKDSGHSLHTFAVFFAESKKCIGH